MSTEPSEAPTIPFNDMGYHDDWTEMCAAVFPTIVTGSLNAPTIVMADEASDHTRGITPLPPWDLPFYQAGGKRRRSDGWTRRRLPVFRGDDTMRS